VIFSRFLFPSILLSGMVFIQTASASLSFSAGTIGTNGAGDNLSAQVTIFLPGETDAFGNSCTGGIGTLCMTLQNTQVGGTQTRGDVLASLYFSIAGSPILTDSAALANTVLRPNSTNTQVLSVAPQSPVLNGGWALVTTPGVDTVNTGLPTSGYAWTTVGNSGAFSNGTYNVGTDNYAVVAPGTTIGNIGGNIPVISQEVFLTLGGFQSGGSSLALSSINNLVFTWNSTGQFSANGTPTTPEPGTAGIVALALIGLVAGRNTKLTGRPRLLRNLARAITHMADHIFQPTK
jgi:hypothetical protein